MTDIHLLQKKIQELEERVKVLEGYIDTGYVQDKALMDQLYQKAKEAVIREQKVSLMFLQRKLLIDLERATRLLQRLEVDGVIGPTTGAEPRKILMK